MYTYNNKNWNIWDLYIPPRLFLTSLGSLQIPLSQDLVRHDYENNPKIDKLCCGRPWAKWREDPCAHHNLPGGQSASWNVRLSATLPHPQTVSKGDNFDLGFCMEEKRIDRHQKIIFATFLRQFSNDVHNLIAQLISSCVLMYFSIFNC